MNSRGSERRLASPRIRGVRRAMTYEESRASGMATTNHQTLWVPILAAIQPPCQESNSRNPTHARQLSKAADAERETAAKTAVAIKRMIHGPPQSQRPLFSFHQSGGVNRVIQAGYGFPATDLFTASLTITTLPVCASIHATTSVLAAAFFSMTTQVCPSGEKPGASTRNPRLKDDSQCARSLALFNASVPFAPFRYWPYASTASEGDCTFAVGDSTAEAVGRCATKTNKTSRSRGFNVCMVYRSTLRWRPPAFGMDMPAEKQGRRVSRHTSWRMMLILAGSETPIPISPAILR